jgi:plastocyanin
MGKKQKKKQQDVRGKTLSRNGYIIIAGIFAVVAIGIYFGVRSTIPVNGNTPVFAAPTNIFIKATYSSQTGYAFTSQSAGGRGRSIGVGYNSPTISLKKGEVASLHLINEDRDSQHNLNIDPFNVHTGDLGYFQSKTVTFIADKVGTFQYYCTIHPEMKGGIIVR